MENKYGIILDGDMTEPIWETVPTHTGFKKLISRGGGEPPVQTEFKVLSCEDRVYVGIKCLEPDGMEGILASRNYLNSYNGHAVEVFFSPSGNNFEFYQFVVTINGDVFTQYYSEGGNIKPDYYRPDWTHAVHIGEDYWSVELEIPLTAFYWTPQNRWNSKWLFNISRDRMYFENGKYRETQYSTWSPLQFRFLEPENFQSLDGFPMRPARDEVRIHSAEVELREQTPDGYRGILRVKTDNVVADTFSFTSDRADTVQVSLKEGSNEFTTPCFYEKEGRSRTALSLTRTEDGKEFKRFYPVLVKYEPIRLHLTKPEYKNNFYPGQDFSKIAGTVKSNKQVTLTLEGPGIEKTTVSPDADGSFCFATPGFQEGTAILTATIDGYEIQKKIRRLAPTGHTMTWISGGNLVVDGKDVLRRNVYAMYWRGGEALKKKFFSCNMYDTPIFEDYIMVHLQPGMLISGCEGAGGEATKDQMPSEEMLRKVDAVIEKNKDRDFGCYYISDEPECRGLSVVYLKHLYQYISEKDPYHVVLSASRSAGSLIEIADWFEAHPYLNPLVKADGTRAYDRQINTMGRFIDSVIKLNRPDKCIGFLPTCFAYKWQSLDVDYPTFDEYICHTWAAMIHGGKSLWPYAYHDINDRTTLFEGTRYIFSSFEALEDIVLHGKRTTLHRTTDAESVLYDNGAEKMFVLVNFNQTPQTVTVDGLTGTWHEFRGSRTFTGNTFEMKPLETIIGTNVVKGADLPTYAEVAALIADAEYKRTHTGSLLYDRIREIGIASSGMQHTCKYKLFDGTPDNLGGCVLEKPDNFVEFDLTKVNPTFSKVVLHGFGVENVELLLETDGILAPAAVKETACEEFAKTFLLAEAVTPEKLRFTFGGKAAELYEIEVF